VTRSLAADPASAKPSDGARRSEILQIAAGLFATSGYVRTSLKDVADACGILPGSLYHHFDSKESIAVELLERYYDELDEIGHSFAAGRAAPGRGSTAARIIVLGTAIAECAVRHRAALQLAVYEPQADAIPELLRVAGRKPADVTAAMQSVLDDGQTLGEISSGVDAGMLAFQLCDTMLHVGLESLHAGASSKKRAELLCQMLLTGIAVNPPSDQVLDSSAAKAAAIAAVEDWSRHDDDSDDRTTVLRAAARAEFARRGYEATTIRDIAAAAGIGIGTVYRLIASKEALLISIMDSFHVRLSAGYDAVAASESTSIAKIDALNWVNINATRRFGPEFDIQRAWFRSSPPQASSPAESLRHRARVIRGIVAAGLRAGELRPMNAPAPLLAPCVRDLIWMSPQMVVRTDDRSALAHARATLLRGAATDLEVGISRG
jgi:AcrR family transcriptional regulator